ncbi:class I SAM-dependent RNA methyltransferase [Gluconobacter kanchanaburiensis]|uniref:class I SAM-dependent RNA methyltransferase n=1 Tax=Gluconobacter kanchanaburiensis TaxID=563199 RepID=UPI0011BDDBFF|nr:TRAM domain-containing protein [Gluconobacter kanchanaburiensis]GBR70748.1 ribosomal large subunit 23S rRNA methyltransferase [Gluconobacter kanchanaburiensis NBRC 103587]
MNDTLTGVSELRIEGLGAAGDGVAHINGQSVFIPGTLPGEDVQVRLSAGHPELISIVHSSPERVTPPCSLFGECGGCALQHLSLPALLEWKSQRVIHALTAAGFADLPSARLFQTKPGTRRRMDFAIQRVPGAVIIGLHRRNGDPVDMAECHILHPAIFELLVPLREVLGSLGALTGRGSLMVNLLDSGPDLTLQTPAPLTSADRAKLAAFARAHNLSRISWQDPKNQGIETVAQSGAVREEFGGVAVSPPPSAFLQAAADAENAIVTAVLDGLPSLNKKDVTVELFAGCGTLTFPMSEKGRVMAYEGNLAAANCLKAAAGGRRVDGFHRDLGRQPLLPQDLKSTRAVVLDPPYAGAGAQTFPLAKSAVPDIIYVSCNPAALEKDGRTLWNAGFSVIGLTIVDQFLWSTEVEAVIVLSRDAKRIRRESSRRSHNDLFRSDS